MQTIMAEADAGTPAVGYTDEETAFRAAVERDRADMRARGHRLDFEPGESDLALH